MAQIVGSVESTIGEANNSMNYLQTLVAKLWRSAIALLCVVTLGLTGCAADPGGLTGNYTEDTLVVVKALRNAVTLPEGAQNKATAQAEARTKINSYAARYQADPAKTGLYSFTTMRTALNALAGYYNNSTRRDLPQKVRDRVLLELDRVEQAISQGQ